MKITLLGTGLMGAPMARNLAADGHAVTVWNRNRARAQKLANVAFVADSPAAAAHEAKVVISMLLDGAASDAVLREQGAIDAAGPGALIIDMGSVDPDCDRRLADYAARVGKRFLDAPVSGGVAGAEAGTLAILVGGAAPDFEAAAPVFKPLGRATLLGPTGAGQAAKLANQLIVASTIGAVAEAFKLAESAGCAPADLRHALKGGFADSRILDLHGARMVSRDFEPGGRSVAQLKDLDNVMDLARTSGLDLPMAETVTSAYRDLVERLEGGEWDHSAYYLWLEDRNGR